MQTNLWAWCCANPGMDRFIHGVGAAFVFFLLPAGVLVLIVWLVRRALRPSHSHQHPVGRTMLPTDLPGGTERVLLVDDEPVVLRTQAAMLADLGYECYTVPSGEEAVAFIREHRVDIVLLDMVMDPGINGVETLRQIKAIAPNVAALLVSGYAKPSDVAAAQAMGAGAYLIKPVATGTLATEVRRALDRRKK